MVKELLEYIVKSLVDKQDDVAISVVKAGNKSRIEIKVHEADRGRIIGKDGQTIKAIRALVASAIPESRRITIDIAK